MSFVPRRVFIEAEALNFPIGQQIFNRFESNPRVEVHIQKSVQRITGIPGGSPPESYREGKRTLVVGVRKTLNFQSCKPSAHYQLPLVSGCAGQCEYCYLHTQFGKKPYIRVYVNLDQILAQTARYIEQRKPDITFFEGGATSDPVPVEYYTGSLARTIEFFSGQDYGRFRFVTKFTDVDTLLNLGHGNKTTIRFSINTDYIIKNYEHYTPGMIKRAEAAAKVAGAGYPLGFIIGPVILYDGWERQYHEMLVHLKKLLGKNSQPVTFEIISHRYTSRAKMAIIGFYPDTTLPMDENGRQFKYGQFGYGKYLYPPEQIAAIRSFFTQEIRHLLPEATINYII